MCAIITPDTALRRALAYFAFYAAPSSVSVLAFSAFFWRPDDAIHFGGFHHQKRGSVRRAQFTRACPPHSSVRPYNDAKGCARCDHAFAHAQPC
eukprot:6106772-Pleurochrysis_carterae.AAC.1